MTIMLSTPSICSFPWLEHTENTQVKAATSLLSFANSECPVGHDKQEQEKI